MSKPLPTQNTWAALSPPWNLTQLDANFTNVWAAFADVGTYSNVYTDTGAVNAMVVTLPAGLTVALAAGLTVGVKVANTNTSATVTLNLNGTGAVGAKDINGGTLLVGQLQIGVAYTFIYNGGLWCCQNINNFSGGSGAPLVLHASKAAITNRISTITQTNDPDLVLAIPFAGRWAWEVVISFYSLLGSATCGFVCGINYSGTFTNTSSIISTILFQCGTAPTSTTVATFIQATPTTDTRMTINGAIASTALNPSGLLLKGSLTATGAGNLGFSWAQQTSVAQNLAVSAGGYMTATSVN
jgi:hypothetical protein